MSAKENPKETNQADDGKGQATPLPLHVPPPTHPRRNKPNPQRATKKFLKEWRYELEAAIVLCTVGYAIITFLEWRTFDSERKTMEGEFRQSQTNFSVQMDEARKQRELDERAWVFVTIPNGALNTNSETLDLTLRNVGKTPALITSLYGHWTIDRSKIPLHDPIGTNHPFMLIPNRDTTMRITVSFDETMQILHDANVYQHGTVYYSDIFGSNHWSQFCFCFLEHGRIMAPQEFHGSCEDLDVKR